MVRMVGMVSTMFACYNITYFKYKFGAYYSMKPQWGSRHDAVVKQFEAAKKEGSIKETVLVSRK